MDLHPPPYFVAGTGPTDLHLPQSIERLAYS